jgi:endonuclease YncB( thermonuclease family)
MLRRLIKNLSWSRRRLPYFWLAAAVLLPLPWFISCTTDWGSTAATCTVASVHDGDTLRASCGGKKTKVRLYCIDAPEMAQKPWGRESRDHLRRLASRGSQVQIRQKDKDDYGRIVGEVLNGSGDNLNLQMVVAGRAAVYSKYCSDTRYFQAQDVAKATHSGIWARPGLHRTPWKYRHR